MTIEVNEKIGFRELNEKIRSSTQSQVTIKGCMGQRYIGTGVSHGKIEIYGTPGNALGAYLNGGEIYVRSNAQDATGDTMNGGSIIIYGSAGDATGYAMRGGRIYVQGNTGYRAGIHMKEYADERPVLVVGGRAGSFLGEYQAGGVIVVLGMNDDGLPVVNNFCGTGMHGGRIYLRCTRLPHRIPEHIRKEKIRGSDSDELVQIVSDYCRFFDAFDSSDILNSDFFVLSPNTENPYKKMYTNN